MDDKSAKASISGQRRRRFATRLLNIHHRYTRSEPPLQEHPIRVVCLSDTHNFQPTIPPGDLLIHSGDLSEKGTFKELQRQLDWLAGLPHRHKIVIGGNHDLLLDEKLTVERLTKKLSESDQNGNTAEVEEEEDSKTAKDLDWHDLQYLKNEQTVIAVEVMIEGELTAPVTRNLRIYGSPITPYPSFKGPARYPAFQHPRGDDMWKEKVPIGTDILVTHGPPHLHLDSPSPSSNMESPFLAREIARTRPRLVVFGHIHSGHGSKDLVFDDVQGRHDEIQRDASRWTDLMTLTIDVSMERVMCRISGKKRRELEKEKVTTLVNAAVVEGRTANELKFEVIIVNI